MSADLLRKAAREMREKAEAATPGPWGRVFHPTFGLQAAIRTNAGDILISEPVAKPYRGSQDATHIASWHPAVALAVADWLQEEADAWAEEGGDGLPYFRAYMVAVTYLGTDA